MINMIRFPHQKLKLKRLQKIKKKRDNSFLSLTATPINFTENFLQTPASKSRGKYKYKRQAKTAVNSKKMGSRKIKES